MDVEIEICFYFLAGVSGMCKRFFDDLMHRVRWQLDYIARKGMSELNNKVSNSSLFCFRGMQIEVPGSLKISGRSNHSHKKGRFAGFGLGI